MTYSSTSWVVGPGVGACSAFVLVIWSLAPSLCRRRSSRSWAGRARPFRRGARCTAQPVSGRRWRQCPGWRAGTAGPVRKRTFDCHGTRGLCALATARFRKFVLWVPVEHVGAASLGLRGGQPHSRFARRRRALRGRRGCRTVRHKAIGKCAAARAATQRPAVPRRASAFEKCRSAPTVNGRTRWTGSGPQRHAGVKTCP